MAWTEMTIKADLAIMMSEKKRNMTTRKGAVGGEVACLV
jgi:hypothetical protein